MAHTPESQRNGIITVVSLVMGLLVVLTFIIGNNYFQKIKFEKTYEAVLSAENPALLDLQAREQIELNSYAWESREAGVVRIPVERAMELVVQEDRRLREGSGGE